MTAALPGRSTRSPLERRSGALFSWDIADLVEHWLLDARTGQAAVYTRAGVTGVYHDGFLATHNVVHSLPRIGAYLNNATGLVEPALLLEQAAKNVVVRSEDFGTTWSLTGTPTLVSAAGNTGDVALDLIGDDAAGAVEGYYQNLVFTGDGAKGVGCYIAQGSSSSTVIRLRDTTSSANRLLATITWSGGLPVITMTTGVSLGYIALAPGRFLIQLQSTSVTAAHTNELAVFPATTAALAVGDVGTIYMGGVHASDDAAPGTYAKTTSAAVTKTADALSWPIGFYRQSLTIYLRAFNISAGYNSGGGSRNLLMLGSTQASQTAPFIYLGDQGSQNGTLFGRHDNNSTTSSSSPTPTTLPGDLIELRLAVDSAGAATCGISVTGAAEVLGSTGSACALGSSWQTSVVAVMNCALSRIRIVPGVQSLASMRGMQ